MVARPDVGLYVSGVVYYHAKYSWPYHYNPLWSTDMGVMGTAIQMLMGACDHMDFATRTLLETQVGLGFECMNICEAPELVVWPDLSSFTVALEAVK